MRTIQERIAAFPSHILVDLAGLGCDAQFGVVKPGETGYVPIHTPLSFAECEEIMCREHSCRPATAAERAAAQAGSMFGWEVPGADPERYGEDGRFRKD